MNPTFRCMLRGLGCRVMYRAALGWGASLSVIDAAAAAAPIGSPQGSLGRPVDSMFCRTWLGRGLGLPLGGVGVFCATVFFFSFFFFFFFFFFASESEVTDLSGVRPVVVVFICRFN